MHILTWPLALVILHAHAQGSSPCETAVTAPAAARMRPGRRAVDLTKPDAVVDGEIVPRIAKRLIAQPQILQALTRQLYRARHPSLRRGLAGAVMLYGPTGVGKNRAGELLADAIGGTLIELEGGNFQTSADVSTLTGASPQWVGHGKTEPALTQGRVDAARGTRLPITVVMINEIDKAHPNFIGWWLKAMDTGRNVVWEPKPNDKSFNAGAAQTQIDLRRVLLIATTNAAADDVRVAALDATRGLALHDPKAFAAAFGFGDLMTMYPPSGVFDRIIQRSLDATFGRPEFVGRFDELVPAWPLLAKGYLRVAELEVRRVRESFAAEDGRPDIHLRLTPRALALVAEQFTTDLGARNVAKVIDKLVKTPVSKALATGEIRPGDLVVGRARQGDDLIFGATPSPTAFATRRRSYEGGLDDDRRQRLAKVRQSDLPATDRLTQLRALTLKLSDVPAPLALELLRAIPRGADWAYAPHVVQSDYVAAFARLGLGPGVAAQKYAYTDVVTVVSLLGKLARPISAAERDQLRAEAIDVIDKSLGGAAAPAGAAGEQGPAVLGRVYAMVEALLAEAAR